MKMFNEKNIEKIAEKIRSKKLTLKDVSAEQRPEVLKLLKSKNRSYTVKEIKAFAKGLNNGSMLPTNVASDEELMKSIKLAAEAYKFMEKYVNKDGTGSLGNDKAYFISERIRNGFVGAEITTDNGVYLQTNRGKPYGTAVAIPVEGNKVVIGYSFISSNEKFSIPIIGLYLAYKRAEEGKKNGKHSFVNPYTSDGKVYSLNSNTVQQLEHFEKRALCYFYPEIYSHSRGKPETKIVFENYDKIHARQVAILGKEKVEASKPKPSKNKK